MHSRSMGEREPYLIYLGSDICYHVLDEFALQLGKALEEQGETVEYYNVSKQGEGGLSAYVGRRFRAVIGFQSYLFDIYLPKAGVYLHDLIEGPKLNFQFDHPVWMNNHYRNLPKDCYILTHDRDYASFIRRYYPKAAGVYVLPPAGSEVPAVRQGWENADPEGRTGDRSVDVAFIGTYTDYRQYLLPVWQSEPFVRHLAACFLRRMHMYPNEAAEVSLWETLKQKGIVCGDGEYLGVMDGLKSMIYCIMSYYREQVVRTLLEGGIVLDVYGESWRKSPFAKDGRLRIHPALTPQEVPGELCRSKVSLNVMAWHKDGFTERIAGSMLCGSVVCTDTSRYLAEHFRDGEELLLFDLQQPGLLPGRIRDILSDEGRRRNMAGLAYARAAEEHTWKQRALELRGWLDAGLPLE